MKRRDFFRSGFATAGAGVALTAGLAAPSFLSALSPLFDPRAVDADDLIRLSSNENPLGVSAAGRKAVLEGGLIEANRYPGATGQALRTALANQLGVEGSRLFFGAGSTEILRVAVQAWAGPSGRLIQASPTFEDVTHYCSPFSYETVSVPLTSDYAHDIGQMRDETEATVRPTVVYLCNPNNPTGTLTRSADIEEWIRSASERTLFVVDEAYLEYVRDPGYRSAIDFTADHENVIVVRTFSKIYGMAGMRLGFGVAHRMTVRRLWPFLTRNSPNHLAGVAAIASLGDPDLIRDSLEVNRRAREILEACLDELEVERLPSHTNFLMHRIRGELGTYIERMAEAGFRVGRPFPPMLAYNRISFGLPEQMEHLAETLRTFRRRGWI